MKETTTKSNTIVVLSFPSSRYILVHLSSSGLAIISMRVGTRPAPSTASGTDWRNIAERNQLHTRFLVLPVVTSRSQILLVTVPKNGDLCHLLFFPYLFQFLGESRHWRDECVFSCKTRKIVNPLRNMYRFKNMLVSRLILYFMIFLHSLNMSVENSIQFRDWLVYS